MSRAFPGDECQRLVLDEQGTHATRATGAGQRVLLALLLAGAAATAVAAASQAAPGGLRRGSPQRRGVLLEGLIADSDAPDGYDDPASPEAAKRAATDGTVYSTYGATYGYSTDDGGSNSSPPDEECLCLFDVDRTLTAKQKHRDHCQFSWGEEEAFDTAFHGGPLLLSYLGVGMSASACSACHKGIVSNGDASGPRERAILARQLGLDESTEFTSWKTPSSPLVIGCPNGQKQDAAKNLLSWFENAEGISIEPSNVFLFDDLPQNIEGFRGSGMNAHQISCSSRDEHQPELGLCGGRLEEVTLTPGVTLCNAGA